MLESGDNMCFLIHFYYLFVISWIWNSFCVKCSKQKKGTRSATTNFGKEEVLIIQEGGAWARKGAYIRRPLVGQGV